MSVSDSPLRRSLSINAWVPNCIQWAYEPLSDPLSGLRLLFLTWNMKGRPGPTNTSDLSELLLLYCKHHIYVISSQECMRSLAVSVFYSSMRDWEVRILQTLGPEYELLTSDTLGGTHLMLISHKSISYIFTGVNSDRVSTGFFNMMPNKGGVGISFQLNSRSFLVIGCHLTSGEQKVEARNNDFRRIENDLQLGIGECQQASDRFDCTVVLGDLNYRIGGSSITIRYLIGENERLMLLKKDELWNEMSRGHVAFGYREADIGFPPTFKIEDDQYSEKRTPSWTDRIIVKDRFKILVQCSYGALHRTFGSDHRPVFSQFIFSTSN